MKSGKIAVNIRFGSVHVMSPTTFKRWWSLIHVNTHHQTGGEFKSRSNWRWFDVYRPVWLANILKGK